MSEEAAVKSEEKKVLIDDELFNKLEDNEVEFDTLSEEQKIEFHNRFVVNKEEIPKEPVKEPKKEVKAESEETKEDISPEEQERRKEWKRVRDENNTLQQRLASVQEKLGVIQKNKIDAPPKLQIDEYDENTKKQAEFNQSMATKVNNWVDAETASLGKEVSELKERALFSSVAELQFENQELSTSKPIKVLDSAFMRFRDTLAPGSDNEAKSKAVSDFLSNPEKRAQAEASGILFPFTDEDWQSYKTISEVHAFKRNGGDPAWDADKNGDKYADLDVAYYKYRKQAGHVPDGIKRTAIETHQKVIDQLQQKQSQTTLLSPNNGSSSAASDGMTEAQMEAWLIAHPTPSTPEEVKTLKLIMAKLMPK